MKTYEVYARILYLAIKYEKHCYVRTAQSCQPSMNDIVRTVIAQDKQLVWC